MIKDISSGLLDALRGVVEHLSPHMTTIDGHRRVTAAVRNGYELKQLDLRTPARRHTFGDVDSLIAYARRHGKPDRSTVFCDARGFRLVVDDDASADEREHLVYEPAWSEPAKAWQKIAQAGRPHAEFRDAVEDRATDVPRSLVAALLVFNLRTTVEYDASNETSDSVSFRVEKTQGKGISEARLPKTFDATYPLFTGWGTSYPVSYRLEFELKDGRIVFSVTARNWDDAVAAAIGDMASHVRTELGGEWLIVRGTAGRGALK